MIPTYLASGWTHDFEDEPCLPYYEIDDDRYAIRSIEVFKDGRMLRASKDDLERNPMALPDQPVPPVEEINGSEEFRVWKISAQQFEKAWSKVPGDRSPGC